MKNYILILITLFLGIKSYSQDLNRKNLISQLKAEKESLFVINGIPFSYPDSLKLDVELRKIDNNKISEITILKNEGKISHQRNDIILIAYASYLSKKIIKKQLNEIKPKFKDHHKDFSQNVLTNTNDPVLYLNGNKIHYTETKKILKNLKINNIGYIYFSKSSPNKEYYGRNIKNGIVIIWTKDKLIR